MQERRSGVPSNNPTYCPNLELLQTLLTGNYNMFEKG